MLTLFHKFIYYLSPITKLIMTDSDEICTGNFNEQNLHQTMTSKKRISTKNCSILPVQLFVNLLNIIAGYTADKIITDVQIYVTE